MISLLRYPKSKGPNQGPAKITRRYSKRIKNRVGKTTYYAGMTTKYPDNFTPRGKVNQPGKQSLRAESNH